MSLSGLLEGVELPPVVLGAVFWFNKQETLSIPPNPDRKEMASTVIVELNERQALEGARFLQAIAHPKRLLLLTVLSDRQLSAGRLAALVGLPQGMIYKHLHKLVEAGLLSVSDTPSGMRFSIASPQTALKFLEIQTVLAPQISKRCARKTSRTSLAHAVESPR